MTLTQNLQKFVVALRCCDEEDMVEIADDLAEFVDTIETDYLVVSKENVGDILGNAARIFGEDTGSDIISSEDIFKKLKGGIKNG